MSGFSGEEGNRKVVTGSLYDDIVPGKQDLLEAALVIHRWL
jgi:hypothetical protein